MFKGKHIVLGITGSIAAYKAAMLARLFIKAGAEVQVVITPSGKQFITPVTMSALTGKPVVSEFFAQSDGQWHSHVDLGLWADAMVIAPATASTIGKMAHGIADNMLVTTYLSMKAPVFVAPAMDLDMFAHPSTQHNLLMLEQFGNIIIQPDSGELASHLTGKGRMAEPQRIVDVVGDYLSLKQRRNNSLRGKTVLITAGPTYEKIDPVRFIGNYSSGKMGFALAAECARRGATVQLIAGPVSLDTPHGDILRTDVESAQQMYDAATTLFTQCDIAILCAAVADFTPLHCATSKIKREGQELTLTLQSTKDIARALGESKQSGQVLVGFALETDNEEQNAQDKLCRKSLDMIVLNSLRTQGAGFRHDTNQVTVITADKQMKYALKSKHDVAKDIIDCIEDTFNV